MKQVIDTKPWITQVNGKFYLHVNSFVTPLTGIQDIMNCCTQLPASPAVVAEPIQKETLSQAEKKTISSTLKARAEERKKQGICIWCDRRAVKGKSICQHHVTIAQARRRESKKR